MAQGAELKFSAALTRTLDTQALLRRHRLQASRGELAAVQQLDPEAEVRRVQRRLEDRLARLNRICQARIALTVDSAGLDQAAIDRLGIHGPDAIVSRCRLPIAELAGICRYSEAARAAIRSRLRQIRCRVGRPWGARQEGFTLEWTVDREPQRSQEALLALRKSLVQSPLWGSGETLSTLLFRTKQVLCQYGDSLYVGIRPSLSLSRDPPERPEEMLEGWLRSAGSYLPNATLRGRTYYGDGANFTLGVRCHGNIRARCTFRDLRTSYVHSAPEFRIDTAKKQCHVQCGKHRTTLRLLNAVEAEKIVTRATFRETAPRRRPHGLARDRRGIYYFVDRGPERDSRDFRLLVGPTGNLKPIPLLDIASDTRGDLFTTAAGRLRLVPEQKHSFWSHRGQRRKLVNVPLDANRPLVYNDLGVYLGTPFGTPCDKLAGSY